MFALLLFIVFLLLAVTFQLFLCFFLVISLLFLLLVLLVLNVDVVKFEVIHFLIAAGPVKFVACASC